MFVDFNNQLWDEGNKGRKEGRSNNISFRNFWWTVYITR